MALQGFGRPFPQLAGDQAGDGVPSLAEQLALFAGVAFALRLPEGVRALR